MLTKTLVGVVGALVIVSTPAFAQNEPTSKAPGVETPPRPLAACRADVQANCKDVPRSPGQRLQCLRANKDKTSPECQAALQEIDKLQAARKEVNVVCRADLKGFCGAIEKRYAARVACLQQNEAKLSTACRAALAAAPAPSAPANGDQPNQ
jgi:Cysteine rich repeat